MPDLYKESLEFHKKHKGKLEVISKVKISDRHVLSLAYTPGVAEASREIAKDPKKAYEYTIKQNSVAVISDGSAVEFMLSMINSWYISQALLDYDSPVSQCPYL